MAQTLTHRVSCPVPRRAPHRSGLDRDRPGTAYCRRREPRRSRRRGVDMTGLPTRELGRTGLRVTRLGYGAMELRGAPRARDTTEAQAETILNAVLDAGINYIDTS